MKKNVFLLPFLALFLVLFVCSYAFGQEKEILIRYTHMHPTSYSHHRAAERLAKLVGERTNGRVKFQVYPASQLYQASETVKAVASGAVEMGHCAADEWGLIFPLGDIFAQPFLTNSVEVRKELTAGKIGQMLEKEMIKAGAKPLMWMPYDTLTVFVNNKHPLRVPQDFQGLLLRTTPGMIATVEALGGKAVRMNIGEVYMALQRGTIDGSFTGPTAGRLRKLYEVSKYSTIIDMVTYINVAFINVNFWDKLPGDLQKIIEGAAEETEKWTEEVAKQEESEGVEVLKQKTQAYFPSTEEIKLWEASTKSVAESYVKKGDASVKAAYEEINRLKGQTKK